jgi:hypothetical protein
MPVERRCEIPSPDVTRRWREPRNWNSSQEGQGIKEDWILEANLSLFLRQAKLESVLPSEIELNQVVNQGCVLWTGVTVRRGNCQVSRCWCTLQSYPELVVRALPLGSLYKIVTAGSGCSLEHRWIKLARAAQDILFLPSVFDHFFAFLDLSGNPLIKLSGLARNESRSLLFKRSHNLSSHIVVQYPKRAIENRLFLVTVRFWFSFLTPRADTVTLESIRHTIALERCVYAGKQ